MNDLISVLFRTPPRGAAGCILGIVKNHCLLEDSMKTIALLLFAVGAFTASPFDGTWKLDLGTVKLPEKPDTFATVNEMHSCSSCVPPVTGIKADGTDQSVTGQTYNQISVRIVNPRTLQL